MQSYNGFPADIEIGGHMYTCGVVYQAMNYGDPPIFSELPTGPKREQRQDRFNAALVYDLVAHLYPHSTWTIRREDSEVLYKAAKFEQKQTTEEYKVLNTILTDLHEYSNTGQRLFPLCFHVVNIIKYLDFLIKVLKGNSEPVKTFRSEMTNFWTDQARYGKDGSAEANVISEKELWWGLYSAEQNVNHALGLSLHQNERFHDREVLCRQFGISVNYGSELRKLVLKAAGLNDVSVKDISGPLDHFSASNLHSGSFIVALTETPSKHLTIERGLDPRPKILLLNLEVIFERFYTLQRCGVARCPSSPVFLIVFSAAGIPTIFVELLYAHGLFFCQDHVSIKAGEVLRVQSNGLGVEVSLVKEFYKSYTVSESDAIKLRFEDFPIYATRLQELQEKMNNWRPRTIRGRFFTRPYQDPLSFYAVWFGSIITVVTILGFGATLAGTYATFKAIPVSSTTSG